MMAAEEGLGDGFRKVDDLLLHLKGLVLVRQVRERRGADEGELLMTAWRSIACATSLRCS